MHALTLLMLLVALGRRLRGGTADTAAHRLLQDAVEPQSEMTPDDYRSGKTLGGLQMYSIIEKRRRQRTK